METASSTDASPAVDPAYTPDAVFHAADVTRPLAHTDTIDPVAEADMYLAYGRDVQAEEVLQTALRQQPAQLPVYVKLAEIYTKRQDSQALERLARDMQSAAPQPSPEWQQVMAMGMQLAPANAFFAAAAAAEAATDAAAMPTDATYATRPGNATSAVQAMPAAETSEAGDTPAAATVTEPNSLDLDIAGLNLPAAVQAEAAAATAPVHVHEAPDVPLPAEDTATAVAPLEPEAGSLEVDLGSLDLDLGVPPTSAAPAQPVHNHADDPLSTKLALAQEFQTIGDSEGARALIEEVLAQATGPLQARAQQMLSELN